NRAAVMFTTLNRYISSMISRLLFLFITCLMFFINDNNTDVCKRSKNSRSCANNNLYVALLYAPPFVILLPRGKSAMHHRNFRSEEHTSELQSRFDLVCRPLL